MFELNEILINRVIKCIMKQTKGQGEFMITY